MTEIFKTYIHTDENVDMAILLKPICFDILKVCEKNKNYKNGKSSYYEPNIIKNHISKLKPFYDYIRKNVKQYLIVHNYDTKDLSIDINDLWVSEMNVGGKHDTHGHSPGSQISGNFYVNVDSKSGLLRFYRQEYHNNVFYNLKIKNYNEYNNDTYTFKPKNGLLCLWRSDLLHSVDYNESESRIAISFNITLNYIT